MFDVQHPFIHPCIERETLSDVLVEDQQVRSVFLSQHPTTGSCTETEASHARDLKHS